MSYENIVDGDGFGIAATGMVIVFVALTSISLFISALPRILDLVAIVLPPPVEHKVPESPAARRDDRELVAAIGFAMHHKNSQQSGRSS